MHRTDTTEYRAHAPPSAVSVVPAQSYLVYLCASSPDSRVASLIFRGRYLRYRLSRTLIEQMRSGRYYRKARCTPEVPQISEVPSAERSRLPGCCFPDIMPCDSCDNPIAPKPDNCRHNTTERRFQAPVRHRSHTTVRYSLRKLRPSSILAAMRRPDCVSQSSHIGPSAIKTANPSYRTGRCVSQSSHGNGQHHQTSRFQPTDPSPCEPILT